MAGYNKNLSSTENLEKLLELFYETSDIYQLSNIEYVAVKKKGILIRAVKTTLQELVDSGQVRTEKISGNKYYWVFPSDALLHTKTSLAQAECNLQYLDNKIVETQLQINKLIANKINQCTTNTLKTEIEGLKREKHEFEKHLECLRKDVDFQACATKANETNKLIEASNRWIDNIFNVKSWCKRKFEKDDQELNKAFDIPDNLDYLTN